MYKVTDLLNENDVWTTDLSGLKEFLAVVWIDDEDMIREIYSHQTPLERLQEIGELLGYDIEQETNVNNV